MAGLFVKANSGDQSLSAATKRTLLQITAPTNQAVKVTGFDVSFNGTSPTAEPVKVQLSRQNVVLPSGGAVTEQKMDPAASETIQTTALSGAGDETGITDTVLKTFYVHPQGGWSEAFPFGQEIMVRGGARFAVIATAAASVTTNVTVTFEE